MFYFIILSVSHTYKGNYENIVKNECNFDVLKIQRNDIKCIDYGINKKYCDHYSQAKEITIIKKKNSNNVIISAPHGMWEDSYHRHSIYDSTKIATFYYTFTCKNDKTSLTQHIIPEIGFDIHPFVEFILTICVGFLIFFVLIFLTAICGDVFVGGLLCSSVFYNSNNKRRVVCR